MKLSNQIREDLLVTALEGGSNYWYKLDFVKTGIDGIAEGEPTAVRIFKAVVKGIDFPVLDAETDDVLGTLNMKNIKRGEKTMQKRNQEHFIDILSGSWDADTADIWFQYAVMNEITFG